MPSDGDLDEGRASNSRPRPWGQDRRLEFIEFRLLWDGKINRGQLAEYFGVSLQQASLDFARYMVLAEDNMEYDRSEKYYRATEGFRPLFVAPDAQAYLNELSGLATGTISPALSFVGSRPPCDVVTLPVRRPRLEILRPMLWAIRDRAEIEITYQSMRESNPTRQWIAPHSLAFDGARWHARAWCYRTHRFRDFVLTRCQVVHSQRQGSVDPGNDIDWQTFVVVEIEPNPRLTTSQRDTVTTDFGMQNGKLSKTIRRALLPYFTRHLQIDRADDTQPIVWSNRSEFNEREDAPSPSPQPSGAEQ
jgi:predicted DNA-binding transcriptional regulator YafY